MNKKQRENFSMVSNRALKDNELSLKAKGLYGLIQAYITIDNFIIHKSTLKKNCKEKSTSFDSAWKELKDNGYLIQQRFKTKQGKFIYQYQLLEVPNHTPKTYDTVLPPYGFPPIYSNTDLTNTDFNNTESLLHRKQTSQYDNNIKAFIKAYNDTFDAEHRLIIKEYNNIYKYDPADIYLMACEFMKDYTIDKCSIDYFEKVIDRYKGIDL